MAGVVQGSAPAEASYYTETRSTQQLTGAIDQRLALMRDVAAAKWLSGAPIRDAAREEVVLQQVAARATELGLDAASVRALFELQIRLARDLQQRWQASWQAAGRCPPCEVPGGLQTVRESIDAANQDQLAALYLIAPLATGNRESLATQVATLAARHGLTVDDATALRTAIDGITRAPGSVTLERVRATHVLRIATTGDYAPFSLQVDGRLTGADIELARGLARQLGVEPVFVGTSWPTLSDDLRLGRFDVALSGISYTAERAALGLYSAAYHEGGKTVVARCTDRDRFDTAEEIDRAGVRIVVNPGGTNERYVRDHIHAARVIVHADNRTVFDEIVAGRADLMITDDVEADLQSRRRPSLCRTLPGTLTRGEKRILMAPDPALQAVVDQWLEVANADGVPARALQRAMDEYVTGAR